MPLNTVALAALLFGLILEISAVNLHRKGRPRGETLPLVVVGLVFLGAGAVKLLG